MSDRYNFLTVILEKDIKDEDAEPLIQAIKCLRGVLNVTPNVSDPTALLAEQRAKAELSAKLWKVLYP
jgi:hypothetical protein